MSIKNTFLAVFGIIIAGAIGYSVWQEKFRSEKFDLKLRLKTGEYHEVKYKFSHTLTHKGIKRELLPNMVLSANAQMEKASINAEMIVGLDVKNVEADGTMDIDLFYKTIKLKVDSPRINIDTENMEPIDPNATYKTAMMDVYSSVIDNRFKMKVDSTGHTSAISGLDELKTKVKEKVKERSMVDINDIHIKDRAEAKKWKEMMEKNQYELLLKAYLRVLNFLMKDTKQMIENIIIRFSDQPVSIGSKWYEKSNVDTGCPAICDANTIYKLKRCDENNIHIETTSKIEMKELTMTEINYGDTILNQRSGAIVSLSIIDKDSGLLQKSEATAKFNGIEKREPDRMTLPLRPTESIPVTFEGKMIIELIK
ncbi:MAG: hypothetical protein JW806_03440 [Sedimentisphaerales bacterium]|nr:hypothetical protein [Sedimentisphaerales bacterium]